MRMEIKIEEAWSHNAKELLSLALHVHKQKEEREGRRLQAAATIAFPSTSTGSSYHMR